MKKTLAMGMGALLLAGTAAPASAASHIDFSGYYRIMYMSETNTGYGRESRSFTDSYFQDRLQLDITFRPTDEISVYWRTRGPGTYQRWGREGRDDKSLYTQHIYGEVKQDWGTFLIGRITDDLDGYGLASMGYMPSTIPVFTNVGAFDRGDIIDGIRYSHEWDNGFSILAQYMKVDNNDQNGGEVGAGSINGYSDQDFDRFQLQGGYSWDTGGVTLQVFYDRDASGNGQWDSASYLGFGRRAFYNKAEVWGVNPAFMQTWGDWSLHFEGMAVWGQAEYLLAGGNRTRDVDGSGYGAYLDLDYNYGPGNATLAGWWVSGTDLGDVPGSHNGESESLADLVGGNFYPLLVAYNGLNSNPGGNRYHGKAGRDYSAIAFANNAYDNYIYGAHLGRADLLTGDYMSLNGINLGLADDGVPGPLVASNFVTSVLQSDRTRTLSFNNDTDANHWAIALTGNHAFTEDISMHYGLAYLALNEPNYRIATRSTYNDITNPSGANWYGTGHTTQDKDLGFELDLGVTFKLLDNLTLTSAFGYMFNGDAYKSLKGYNLIKAAGNTGDYVQHGDSVKAVWDDPDDSYVWFNSLTFEF